MPSADRIIRRMSPRRSSLGGASTFTFSSPSPTMLVSTSAVILILVLTEHHCQTTTLSHNHNKHNEFNGRQTNWSPVNPGLLATQLKAQTSDGALAPNRVHSFSTTTSSPSSTVSKDIRKLLEDYVTYLSTLPDFQKEVNLARTKIQTSHDSEQNGAQFSTPETFTLVSTPMATSSSNGYKIALDAIETQSDNTGGGDVLLQTSPSNAVHRIGSSNYYLEMPTESGLTLNLSDDELSSFIDNVLGQATTPVGTTANSSSTMATTQTAPRNEFEESALRTITPAVQRATPASVTLESSLIVTSNLTNAHSNDTARKTSTDLPFSRAEMFDNSEEIVDTSNEQDINLVTKEAAGEQKESTGRFYTSDGETVTEAANTSDEVIVADEKRPLTSNLNETTSSGEEDETNSNNYNRKANPIEDTELARELQRTKGLLRLQIEKLQLLENADDADADGDGQSTTTVAPFEPTTGEPDRGLRNANDTDVESLTTTTTELPPVSGSGDLVETTTASAVASEETSTTDLPIGTSTEAPNEFKDALAITTTTSTVSALINENFSIGNYSRASLKESDETTATTVLSSAEGNDDVLTEATTAVPSEAPANSLRTSTNESTLPSGAMKTEQQQAPEWNTTPVPTIDDGAAERLMAIGEAENSTAPALTFDLTVANSSLSFGNASLDSGARNESDSETMILTHVPKITIIHKILKPNKSGGGTEEEAYREALRKHKDLIKTAMSSISLVPAAFKRYRINNKNKVNIGEIYLLPNFAGKGNGRVRSHERGQPHKVAFERKFVQELGQAVTNVAQQSGSPVQQSKPIIIRQAMPNLKSPEKFAFTRITGNKFNAEEPVASAPSEEELLQNRALQEARAKLYVSYLNSVVAKDQNPENIIKLYRPRFLHRKRFKKVRIPTGYRVKKKVPLTTISTSNGTSGDKKVVTFLNASPILITIAQSSEQHNQTVARPPLAPPPRPQAESSASTAYQQPQPQFVASQLGAPLPKKEVTRSREAIDKTQFKVFCTYDAHRSLSLPANDSRGRFFDIHQLEQNAAVLEQCTHLVYAFASINMNGQVLPGAIVSQNEAAKNETVTMGADTLVRIKALKKRFPHLRVLVAVGGWNTPPQLFSLLVATSKLRDRLSANVHRFVLNYEFDGAIIAWFYPVYGSKTASDSQRSPRSASGQMLFQLDDKQNLVRFMRSLKNRFDSLPHQTLEIGLMSPPFEEQIDRGFDVAKLRDLVDHMILLTFDYFGAWDERVHHFAPLLPLSKGLLTERDRKLNINYTLSYWLNEKQAPRDKTLLGVAFYGRSFTLDSPASAEPGAKAIGPGIAGPITNKPGLLAFNELCDLYLGHPAVRLNEDEYRITAHLQLFDQWVGFDDELSLYLKTKYAISNHLSGIFIWSINHDDYRNRCGWGRFPLIKAIHKAVEHCQASAVPCKV